MRERGFVTEVSGRLRVSFLKTGVIVLLAVIAWAGTMMVLNGHAELLWFLALPVAACVTVLVMTHRRPMKSLLPEHLVTSASLICVLGIGVVTAGAHLGGLIWALFLPALAIVLFGWRVGMIYTSVSFVALLFILWLHLSGTPVPVPMTAEYALRDVLVKAPLAVIAVAVVGAGIQHQLRRSQRALARRQQFDLLGKLTGSVAHDFNNILAVIVGNLEMLDETVKDNIQAKALVADLRGAAMSGSELIRGLQSLSRQKALLPRPIPLGAQINENLPLIRRAVAKDKIAVELHDESDGAVAEVDPAQLDSALLNLCINARDAMPEGGNIDIRIYREALGSEEQVILEVRDNGIGMSREVADRAMRPFFSTKAAGEGSGLGLSMVQAFAENANGTVSLASEPGNGTRIRIALPRVRGADLRRLEPVERTPPRGHEHVLAVDDEPGLRAVCCQMLESLGYRVTMAANALEARQLLSGDRSISAVLTDWVMPGQSDGYQLASWVKDNFPDTAVLITSGYARSAPKNMAFPLLQKPFTRLELAQHLRDVLDDEQADAMAT